MIFKYYHSPDKRNDNKQTIENFYKFEDKLKREVIVFYFITDIRLYGPCVYEKIYYKSDTIKFEIWKIISKNKIIEDTANDI